MNALASPRNWLRLAWGTALLAVPAGAITSIASGLGADGNDSDDVATAVVRVLGVRHVAQAVMALLLDGSRVSQASRTASAALDAAHVASLPVLARLAGPADRRLLALDAPVEVLLAALQLRAARD